MSTITQTSDGIFIDGYRKYSRRSDTDAHLDEIPNGGNYWWSDLVALYGTPLKQVHFVYTIRLSGEVVRGYIVLTPKGDPINKLVGTYTHLAPNKLTGDIVFERQGRNN